MGLSVLSLVSLTLAGSPAVEHYAGHSAIRVVAADLEQARMIERLAAHLLDENLHAGPMTAVVDGSSLAALDVAGFDYTVLEADVYGRLAAERQRIDSGHAPRDFDEWFSEFKPLDEIHAHVDALAALEPGLVEVTAIGSSIEGRPIELAHVGTGNGPAVVITGTQHAREWIASMVPMCVLDHLVRNQDDPVVLDVLARANLYIVPVVNPDGFLYTWETDRYWRKNRRNGTGVDLNRNWGQGWGLEQGSSPDPESDVYHGLGPFSEPETAALRDFLEGQDVAALIDFHSFAGVVSSSWAYTDESPDDITLLRAWGDGLAAQINARHDYGYLSLHGMQANETIGYAAGTQPDWAHANLAIPAFTIELRPGFDDEDGGGFELPPEMIVPTCEEIVPAVLDLARWATGAAQPTIGIVQPLDGAVFEDAPAATDILVAVDYAGPLSSVKLEVNGQLLDWDDPVFPHEAGIEFPKGTWELVAHATTWDGKNIASEPITVTVGEEAGDGSSTDDGSLEGGDGEDSDDSEGPEDTGGTDEDGTGTSGADQDATNAGCGCHTDDRPMPTPALAPLVLLALRGRRR